MADDFKIDRGSCAEEVSVEGVSVGSMYLNYLRRDVRCRR